MVGPELWFTEHHAQGTGLALKASKILVDRDTGFQRLTVFENPFFGRVMVLDGLVMTTERDEFFYHEMLVHPVMTAHEDPKRVLIIGGGDGGTLREVLRYPVEEAVLVEIDPAVIEAAKAYFPTLSGGFQDPRARVIVEDGTRFVRETSERFDVVIVDSSDPVGPAAALYTPEFFKGLRRVLRPKGWAAIQAESPVHQLPTVKRLAALLREAFPQVYFYLGPVPTYPGGLWSYAIAGENGDPRTPRRTPPEGLRYYTPEIHRAAFALPAFLHEALYG